jgi:hypothetical protein
MFAREPARGRRASAVSALAGDSARPSRARAVQVHRLLIVTRVAAGMFTIK